MSYEEKWKVLADLLIKLQVWGVKIPADVMRDLRSAKTMIQVLKADPTQIESIPRIDTYLRNVELYAIFTAEKHGTERVEEWLKKLEGTNRVESREKKAPNSRFIPGVPRDKNWVRIQIPEDTNLEDIKKLVEANNLSYKMQEKDYMFIYGNGENIKFFVKRMAEKFRSFRNC